MSAAALTYDSLLSDVQTYCERDDDPFVAQIPRFLLLAENRIASEVRGLGYLRFVSGTMVAGNPIMVKPARWRESSSFNYTDAAGARHYLFERGYDYCRAFWPVQSATAAPKYYANYDFEHFLLAGTPDSNYAFELAYFERPLPLSSTNQESWTPEDIIWGYREQYLIEHAFRTMKDPHIIAIRPVYHANRKCIEAHIFTCLLALFLLAILRLKLAKRGICLTYEKIISQLRALHVTQIRISPTNAQWYKLEKIPVNTVKIVKILHLDRLIQEEEMIRSH